MQPALPQEIRLGLRMRQGIPVDAPARQRIVHVRDRHDPRRQRNLFPLELFGISRAIPPLVVRHRDVPRHLQKPDVGKPLPRRVQRLRADRHVRPHDLGLVVGQLARLQQDAVGNRDLSYVVQRAGLMDQPDEFRVDHPAMFAGVVDICCAITRA